MTKFKKDSYNCPNCGSVIRDFICDYCGTIFYDFANLDGERANYIRLRINGQLVVFKAILTNVNVEISSETSTFYYDDKPIHLVGNNDRIHINVEMDVVQDGDELFMKIIKPKEES